MAKVLGIDLGTTNSVMAVIEAGDPTILENADYGFRAQVNFQPEPIVKGPNPGYGDRANAYAIEYTITEVA